MYFHTEKGGFKKNNFSPESRAIYFDSMIKPILYTLTASSNNKIQNARFGMQFFDYNL